MEWAETDEPNRDAPERVPGVPHALRDQERVMVRAYRGVRFQTGEAPKGRRRRDILTGQRLTGRQRQKREEKRWQSLNGPVTVRTLTDEELRERGL